MMNSAERFSVEFADGAVAGWRWRNDGAPRILFAHANGFCASTYKNMLERLANRFDIVAPDLRGHGRTTLPADARRHRDWTVYGVDIASLIDRLGGARPGKVILAGHSLGAVSVTLAARGRSDIARLLLIEPVAAPATAMRLARTPFWPILSKRMPLVRAALSRRAQWPDRDSAKAAYARKPLFSSWAEGCLEDYLEDGLNEAGGAVELACKPAWEAANYAAQAHDFWRAVGDRRAPMRVLASDGKDSTVFRGARDRFRKTGVEVAIQSGAGHLLPMQRPGDAAEFLASAAD